MAHGRLEDAPSSQVNFTHTRDRKTYLSRTFHFQNSKSVLIFDTGKADLKGQN